MPQTSDLLDLRGIGQRSSAYRFDLLDRDENVIGELHPDRDNTPTITHDTTRLIQRDMAGLNLTPTDANNVDPLADRIRPNMLLEDGTVHPLGIFLFADASRPRYSYGQPLTASLIDKGFILDQATEHTISAQSFVFVRSVMQALLDEAHIPAVIESSGAVVGKEMSWPAGTSRASILNTLAVVGGYYPPYFDHAGVCQVRAGVDPALVDPVVVYDDGRNIYTPSIVETDDLLRTPNRIIMIGNDAGTTGPVVGVSDVDAVAPFSFANRGFHVTEVVQQQGLANSAVAKTAARTYALSRTIFEHATFDGPPDPRHDGFSVIEFRGERWLEQVWALPLSPAGPMTHTVRKVYAED